MGGGGEAFVDIFGVFTNWTILGVICMQFRVFSRGQGTEWECFLGFSFFLCKQ